VSSTILGILASSGAALSGTYESISTVNGTGASGTVTFSTIPSGYKHLQIRSVATSTSSYGLIRFNSDSASNYVVHFLYGDGASAASTNLTAQTSLYGARADNSTYFSAGIVDILDFNSTTKYKTIRVLTGQDQNGAGTMMLNSGLWLSTSAITSITINTQSGNWATSAQFALYGIKVA
jgi:hypothetical protein